MSFLARLRLFLNRCFPDRVSVIYFFAALACAVVFWTVTVTEEKEAKTYPVQVNFSNVPPGYAVVGPDVHSKINVEVAALGDILKKISGDDISVTIDAGKFVSGPFVHEITPGDVALPSSVSLVRIYPKILQLQLDKRIRARIPLKPQFIGKAEGGKRVAGWKIDPPSIDAEGPQSIIEATKHIPTQPIQLGGRRDNFSIPVVPMNDDPEVSVDVMVQPVLKVSLEEKMAQKVVRGVAVVVAKLPANIEARMEPREIEVVVEGPAQFVEKISSAELFAQVDVGALPAADVPYKMKPAVQFRDGAGSGCQVSSSSPPFIEVLLKEKR